MAYEPAEEAPGTPDYDGLLQGPSLDPILFFIYLKRAYNPFLYLHIH